MSTSAFDPSVYLSEETYAAITDIRVSGSPVPRQAAKRRVRRHELTDGGRLTILAADHPARMVTGIREDHLRMADRRELLARIVRVMDSSTFDGLLATADIIDELFIIQHLNGKERAGFLDRKVVIGSVNRGGAAGSTFELDDRVTGYDVEDILAMNLDAAKFLLRFDPGERDSAETLRYCVETIRACNAHDLPIFVEPLPIISTAEGPKLERDPEKLIKLIGLVSGLSGSSMRIWLKLPYTERFDEVARSTTLPILLLGGEATEDAGALLSEVEQAMGAAPNVRGVLMGRNLLYPPGDDPLPLAQAVAAVVHGTKAEDAGRRLFEVRETSPTVSND